MENYYELLGVQETATNEEIKKAYLGLMKKYHPDVFDGDKETAEEKTRQITEAYSVLKNYLTRKGYDEKLKLQTKKTTESSINNQNEDLKKENPFNNQETFKTSSSEKVNSTDKTKENKEDSKKNHENKQSKVKVESKKDTKSKVENKENNEKATKMDTIKSVQQASEIKEKRILNIVIIALVILLALSIAMTFIIKE